MSNHTTTAIAAVLALAIGAGGTYAVLHSQNHGSSTSIAASKEEATYLTADNALSLINAKMSGGVIASAEPNKPVLLVMCARSACSDEDLNLVGVTRELQGKITVVALDPYANKQLVQSLFQDNIGQTVMNSIGMQMAIGYVQQQAQLQLQKDPNAKVNPDELLASVVKDPRFQAAVQQRVSNSPILQPVYPKVFLFRNGDFKMIASAPGLQTKQQLMSFTTQALKAMEEATAAEKKALEDEVAATKAEINKPVVDPKATPKIVEPAAKP